MLDGSAETFQALDFSRKPILVNAMVSAAITILHFSSCICDFLSSLLFSALGC